MKRLDAFKKLVSVNTECRKLATNLTDYEFDLAVEFIEDHDHLDDPEFDMAVDLLDLNVFGYEISSASTIRILLHTTNIAYRMPEVI